MKHFFATPCLPLLFFNINVMAADLPAYPYLKVSGTATIKTKADIGLVSIDITEKSKEKSNAIENHKSKYQAVGMILKKYNLEFVLGSLGMSQTTYECDQVRKKPDCGYDEFSTRQNLAVKIRDLKQ